MFDDKPNKPNSMAPTNLPMASQKVGREPEDILDTIDEAPESGPTPARPQPLTPMMPVPPAMPKAERATSKEPFGFHYKKFVVIILGILLLAGIAWGGWYAYNTFFKASGVVTNTNQPSTTNQNNVNTNEPVGNAGANTNQPGGAGNEGTPVEPKPVDSDSDGLDDEEEKLYGTNPDRVDTDLDGLTDRDEVKVFKTDPNNPDSDGDTFLDGNEVRAGYDPKGDGKLLEINN